MRNDKNWPAIITPSKSEPTLERLLSPPVPDTIAPSRFSGM